MLFFVILPHAYRRMYDSNYYPSSFTPFECTALLSSLTANLLTVGQVWQSGRALTSEFFQLFEPVSEDIASAEANNRPLADTANGEGANLAGSSQESSRTAFNSPLRHRSGPSRATR